MGAYVTIEKNISDMLEELIQNETICKLLHSSTNSALDDDLPANFKGISLLNTRIFDKPMTPDPTTDTGSFIVVYFGNAGLVGKNNPNQYDMGVYVAVVTHESSWDLGRGRKRPYRLLEEVDKVIKSKETPSIRGSWQITYPAKYTPVNDSFSAYVTKWTVTNSSQPC